MTDIDPQSDIELHTADEQVIVRVPLAGSIRDWWARRRESAPRRPVSKVAVVRTGIGAEKRWPLFGALAVAIVVPLLLPSRFSVGPSWVVPAVVALLLAGNDRRATVVRVLSLALVAVLVAEAAGVTARLIVDLVEGGPETNSATDLLSVGFGVWLYTILAFAFLYWVLDGAGPDGRGFLGWVVWLFIHIGFLTGYRNRIGAVLGWWFAFTRDIRRERTFTIDDMPLESGAYGGQRVPSASSAQAVRPGRE